MYVQIDHRVTLLVGLPRPLSADLGSQLNWPLRQHTRTVHLSTECRMGNKLKLAKPDMRHTWIHTLPNSWKQQQHQLLPASYG